MHACLAGVTGSTEPCACRTDAGQSCNPKHPLSTPWRTSTGTPPSYRPHLRTLLPQLAESSARFLRPHLIPLVDAMMRVAGAGDSLEPETRRSAVEFLVSLCEAREHTPGPGARVTTEQVVVAPATRKGRMCGTCGLPRSVVRGTVKRLLLCCLTLWVALRTSPCRHDAQGAQPGPQPVRAGHGLPAGHRGAGVCITQAAV